MWSAEDRRSVWLNQAFSRECFGGRPNEEPHTDPDPERAPIVRRLFKQTRDQRAIAWIHLCSHRKCRFANALLDPDFRYFSNAMARR